jgi:hypothetical protein
MSLLRRIGAVAISAVLGITLFGPAAHADWTFYRTDPHVIACWEKVTAYGGVYQVNNGLLNGTGGWHTARVLVNRPWVGVIADQTYVAAPGEWKLGSIANVAIVPGDEYLVDLNGARAVGIPAHGIPYYMNHCRVSESPLQNIREAISYGLAQLDAVYTGGCADPWRFGVVPQQNMWHNGSCLGQNNYFQPAGVPGFDCSGLIYKMFQHAGVWFPWASSGDMKNAIPRIDKSQIRVGDLLVKYGHVAMYLGDGNGDGVASVLEARPRWGNPDGSTVGVMISDAWEYMSSGEYTAHRVNWA